MARAATAGPRAGADRNPDDMSIRMPHQAAVQVRAGVVAVPPATKPNSAVARGWRAPFQDSLRTVIAVPLPDRTPPHTWLTDCPPASVHDTCQPVVPAAPAVIVTRPWNPPCQEPVVS